MTNDKASTSYKRSARSERSSVVRAMFLMYLCGTWQGFFVGYNSSSFSKLLVGFRETQQDEVEQIASSNESSVPNPPIEIVMFTLPNTTSNAINQNVTEPPPGQPGRSATTLSNTSDLLSHREQRQQNEKKDTIIVKARRRSNITTTNTTTAVRRTKKGKTIHNITLQAVPLRTMIPTVTAPPQYGLSMVRCKRNVEWINTIPPEWGLAIFEKCQETLHSNYSVQVKNGKGNEDLSAHMQYIATHYNNLPTINIFMQDDGINGYQLEGRTCPHTPYHTLNELETDLKLYLHKGNGFLNLGATKPLKESVFGDPYHREHIGPLLEIMLGKEELLRIQNQTKPKVVYVHGSHWAVSKEQILRHPRTVYQQIHDYIMWNDGFQARRRACALERLLHVLFGEPLVIPQKAYVRTFRNQTEGCKTGQRPPYGPGR